MPKTQKMNNTVSVSVDVGKQAFPFTASEKDKDHYNILTHIYGI